jgi:hypothetical protein
MASSGISLGVALRGQQDVYLMSAKETTFFRAVYTRCTNFGNGDLMQSFDTNPALGRSNIQTTFSRAGDLMGEIYLQYTLDPIAYVPQNMAVSDAADAKQDLSNYFAHYTNGVGYAAMNWNSVRIGQHEFDKQTGEVMFLREQLSAKSDRQLAENVGYLAAHPSQHVALAQAALVPQIMHVPLQFWFNKHVEQALPMIALYWHDVQILLELKSMTQILEMSLSFQTRVTANTQPLPAGPTNFLWLANFYFLDRPERAMFANQKQEIVFGQIQYFGDSTVSAASSLLVMPIRFNHPVIDLTFVLQQAAATGVLTGLSAASNSTFANNQWLNFDGPEFIAANAYCAVPGASLVGTATFTVPYTNVIYLAAEPAVSLQVFLNNQPRTEVLPWKFLRECVPARNYTRIPREAKCAVVSFAIDADDMLSTGTVNFSRLDTAEARIVLWGTGLIPGCAVQLNSGSVGGTITCAASSSLGWNGRAICYARNFNLAKVSLGMMGVKVRYLLLLLFPSLTNFFHLVRCIKKRSRRRGVQGRRDLNFEFELNQNKTHFCSSRNG